jgi:putative FmdB family regulatory protein
MPLYEWACAKCKKAVEVLRSFDGYRDPPTPEEVDAACPEGEHEFEKRIKAPLVARAPGWGGGKGNWALALLFAAASLLSGCGVSAEEAKRAEEACAPNGGVRLIYFDGSFDCKNGARFSK